MRQAGHPSRGNPLGASFFSLPVTTDLEPKPFPARMWWDILR